MEDINLHFTGDIHAITSANNLLSAMIDNHIYYGNELGFEKVVWKRCMDLNDRQLRKIETGLSKEKNIIPREDGFDISVASEIMAILCLASDINDLKRRIGNIIIGYNKQNNPIFARDLKADGALTVLLKDAIKPNLVQTIEGTPAIVHGGPFANIAHGCNSIIATKLALKLGDYVITEAGFGADLGAEKFLDIKCRNANIKPDAVVCVATIKAIKYHGGMDKENIKNESIEYLEKGLNNLYRHIENLKNVFGVNVIVAINKYNHDTIKEKIEAIAQKIYGASKIEYLENTEEKIEKIEKMGYGNLPICIAKTQYSFSDDPKNLECIHPFNIHIKDVVLKAGAEFIVIITGKIMTMPGLPRIPAAENIDIDKNGNIIGIF